MVVCNWIQVCCLVILYKYLLMCQISITTATSKAVAWLVIFKVLTMIKLLSSGMFAFPIIYVLPCMLFHFQLSQLIWWPWICYVWQLIQDHKFQLHQDFQFQAGFHLLVFLCMRDQTRFLTPYLVSCIFFYGFNIF